MDSGVTERPDIRDRLIAPVIAGRRGTRRDALVESLERAGLRGEVLLAPAHGKLEGGMPVVRAYGRTRAITWHAHGLGQLLYELAEPDALARGIRELIQIDDPPGEPVVIYEDEAASW